MKSENLVLIDTYVFILLVNKELSNNETVVITVNYRSRSSNRITFLK